MTFNLKFVMFKRKIMDNFYQNTISIYWKTWLFRTEDKSTSLWKEVQIIFVDIDINILLIFGYCKDICIVKVDLIFMLWALIFG